MNIYPKILIFSNNCFSKTDSNGRTLAGFFMGYPKEKLAQFYIQNAIPDFEICNNYFKVTDSYALRAFFFNKKEGGRVEPPTSVNISAPSSKKGKKRTPLTMLLRNFIWNSGQWKGEKFDGWIKEFGPEIILLQVGDSSFMLKLATEVTQNYNIPLILYNSESYYFKNKNYMRNSGFSNIFYPLFMKKYRKQFDKTIEYAVHSIYSCEELKSAYDHKFGKDGTVIYTSSNYFSLINQKKEQDYPVISYLGNLGVGRHRSLIEMAETLHSINSKWGLDVYGKFPNEQVKKEIEGCKGIRYKGFVTYQEVLSIMQSSDFIVHAENFEPFYKEDLKFAFSTKIADCLSCGTPLLYYAPMELASTKYLLRHQAACVITNKDDLKQMLIEILSNKGRDELLLKNAKTLFEENHNSEKNRNRFWGILEAIYKIQQ